MPGPLAVALLLPIVQVVLQWSSRPVVGRLYLVLSWSSRAVVPWSSGQDTRSSSPTAVQAQESQAPCNVPYGQLGTRRYLLDVIK